LIGLSPLTWLCLATWAHLEQPVMLSKVMWPYYYFQPFVLLLLYEISTLHRYQSDPWRWPVLTGGFLLIASLYSPYVAAPSTGEWDRALVGLLESGAMLVFVAAIWLRLRALAVAPDPSPPLREGARTRRAGRTVHSWARGRPSRRDRAALRRR